MISLGEDHGSLCRCLLYGGSRYIVAGFAFEARGVAAEVPKKTSEKFQSVRKGNRQWAVDPSLISSCARISSSGGELDSSLRTESALPSILLKWKKRIRASAI